VGWEELRELYHWADVFLATPLVEEGFYLPGLEAMAAGAILLSSDAGGNRAYCEFDENCLRVEFDDPWSYVEVLLSLRTADPAKLDRMRQRGYETTERHTLSREKVHFGAFLERLTKRLDDLGPRL
jgi:glycosyltransferase involved in cell wall biosynthesis